MKKQLLLLSIVFIACHVKSQTLPNSGFEKLNSKGNISNWGKIQLLSMGLDTNGNRLDSLVFDGPFYAPTTDAHTGSQALEMRNAYDFKQNISYVGGANLSNSDSDYAAFGVTLIPIQTPVQEFSFYYKYSPVNNDSAMAGIIVFDSSGNEIGDGVYIISGMVSVYRKAVVNINFTSPGTAAFVSISFSNFYTALPGQKRASLGTRLIVDDVSISATSGIDGFKTPNFSVYPNPCSDYFSISTKEPILAINLYDIHGRQFALDNPSHNGQVDASFLSAGDYIIKIITATAVLTKKLVLE